MKVQVSPSPLTLCDLGTSVSSLVNQGGGGGEGEKMAPKVFFSTSDMESVPIKGHGPGSGKLCNRDHSTQLCGKHRISTSACGAFQLQLHPMLLGSHSFNILLLPKTQNLGYRNHLI